jgi:hypothetical protein
MSDYFSIRNQHFLKYSSSTSQKETENFSILLRKKKRIDAQEAIRKNNLNSLLNFPTQGPFSYQSDRFTLKTHIKSNNCNEENSMIEQVFLDSLLESKSQTLKSLIDFDYLEKIISDLVSSPFPDPLTCLDLLELILKDPQEKNHEKNPDLFLALFLKLLKNPDSEENFRKTLKILSIFLKRSRKICESLKKTQDFEDFFMFFERFPSKNSQFAILKVFKCFSSHEEIFNDFEVSAFFDSFRIFKTCDLKVRKKCFSVLVKIIHGP